MTENGVSYIHLVADDEEENNSNGTIIVLPPQTHEHEFHYLETVKPSCEELGYERFQCNGCGELDKRNYTPALGHDYDDIVIREATCKQGGLVLTLCADCGDFYQTTTQAGEHKYKSVNHNATCRNVGYTEHTCEVCGDNYINNIQPLISHSYERVTKEPTCTDKGYTTSTCTMCGLNTVSDYTEPLGHDWDEGHTVTSSTCDAEGVIEYHCLNECGEKMIMATDANGHTPGAEATCTEPQICEVCETVLVLPLGHDYDSDVTDATCTAMGYTTYTCVICDDSYVSDYTDKIDHDYDEVVTEPTCTEHGFTTYTCVDCDDSYVSDYVDAIPHNHKGVVTAPTCTAMGFTTYTCEDCGDSYVGDYVDMTEHNYNKETVEPTCTEHGYAVYTCPDCGKSYISDYKESIEHTYTETVIAPTCTEMGYTIFKCNDCDDEYKGNYTDKIPHDYEKTVTEPTCTEFGFTTYSCKNCDAEYVADYTDKLAHEYEAVVTDATCLTMGYTTYTCECGETYNGESSSVPDENLEISDKAKKCWDKIKPMLSKFEIEDLKYLVLESDGLNIRNSINITDIAVEYEVVLSPEDKEIEIPEEYQNLPKNVQSLIKHVISIGVDGEKRKMSDTLKGTRIIIDYNDILDERGNAYANEDFVRQMSIAKGLSLARAGNLNGNYKYPENGSPFEKNTYFMAKGELLYAFAEKFYQEIFGVENWFEVDVFETYPDSFMCANAASDIYSDIAYSFAEFICEEKPVGNSVKEQKIRFFYDYPECVAYRERIEQ